MHIKTNGFQPINLNQDEIQPKSLRSSFSSFGVLGNFKRELSVFSALTLPLILAACGGGGGGGARQGGYTSAAGDGGNGIVILRMATTDYELRTGLTGTYSVTTSGSDTIISWTASGTIAF